MLDGSASMMAAGRFEEARTLARKALDAVGPEVPVTLLLAAGEPRVLATAADPRAKVEAALAAARPAVVGAGALAAAADAAAKSGAEVLVLTDGCDLEAPALSRRSDLRVISVGKPERNRAVVGLTVDFRRDGKHALFLRVLREDGTVIEEDRSTLLAAVPPGGATTLRVGLDPPLPGDALAADDSVDLVLRPPRPLRVSVVAPGGRVDPYLSAALAACREILDAAGSTALDPAALANLAAAPDVLVVASGADVGGPVPSLVLGAGGGEAMEAPAVQAADRAHPVMRGVDLAELLLTRGRTLRAMAGEAVLLRGPDGPLALAGERGGIRRVLLGFDPKESTLPLSGAWPVLLRNALVWLAGDPETAAAAPGSLLDAAESDLEPRVPRNADVAALPPRPTRGPGPRPLGAAFALAGAACLLLEALLFLLGPSAVAPPGAAADRDSFARSPAPS